jgi:hypothetical protein
MTQGSEHQAGEPVGPRPFTSPEELRDYVESELSRCLPPGWQVVREADTSWTLRPPWDEEGPSGRRHRLWLSDDLSVFCLTFGNSDAGSEIRPTTAVVGRTDAWRFVGLPRDWDASLCGVLTHVLSDPDHYPPDWLGLS